MKHNNDFRYDLKVGQKGESLVADMLEGDKIEVKSEQTKTEKNWTVSGNCYVEYQSRNKESGLAHTESKYWAINFMEDEEHCFTIIMPTKRIKNIARKYYKERGDVKGGDSDSSRGVLVPISALIKSSAPALDDKNLPPSQEDIIAWALSQDNF